MLFRSGEVDIQVKSQGIGTAIMRGLSGAGLVINEFSGVGGGGAVSFGGVAPGGMVVSTVTKEVPLVLSRNTFICCDSEIVVGGKLNVRGLFEVGQEEGFLLPRAAIPADSGADSGRIWLSAFGHVQRHDVPKEKSFWVDNGCFVACTVQDPAQPPYKVDTAVNGLWKSFLSGEGFAMRFEGPVTVWTQNRNLNDFSQNVARLSGGGEDIVDKVETGVDIVSGISSLFSGGSKPKTPAKKTAKPRAIPKRTPLSPKLPEKSQSNSKPPKPRKPKPAAKKSRENSKKK